MSYKYLILSDKNFTTFLLKEQKRNPLYYFESCWLFPRWSRMWRVSESAIRHKGWLPVLGAPSPGWAERHESPWSSSPFSVCRACIYTEHTPSHPTHTNSCLFNCVSLVVSLHAAACCPLITFWLSLSFSLTLCWCCEVNSAVYTRCHDSVSSGLKELVRFEYKYHCHRLLNWFKTLSTTAVYIQTHTPIHAHTQTHTLSLVCGEYNE